MIPPNIQKWIDALRSGEYKQIRYFLRSTVGYSALGVACDISGQGEWVIDKSILYPYFDPIGFTSPSSNYEPEVSDLTYYKYNYITKYGAEIDVLNYDVRKWLGLDSNRADIYVYNLNMIYFNDKKYYDFDEIADIIESNWAEMVTYYMRIYYNDTS